jgi:hypothetical protein
VLFGSGSGASVCTACAAGMADDDSDASTPCAECPEIDCGPGQSVHLRGSGWGYSRSPNFMGQATFGLEICIFCAFL